jgi:hypothetical protein
MAAVIGRFRTKVLNSKIGGTPGGIIASSRSATWGVYGGQTGWTRVVIKILLFLI